MTGQLAVPPSVRGSVAVDGVEIAWERWGRVGAPSVVLVHGTAAHTGWWHHVTPALVDAYDLVAFDLSGHGDSGRRAAYSLADWSRELLAVVTEVAGTGAVVVGHSIGGLVAAGAAAMSPAVVQGLVLVDCLIDEPTPETTGPLPEVRASTVFTTLEEAVERYRLMPLQPVPDVTVLNYVAERSAHEVDGGWSWKLDPRIFDAVRVSPLTTAIGSVACPVALMRGELSALVPPDAAGSLGQRLGHPVRQYDVLNAHHHVMIDQPAPFARLLRRALDELVAEHLDAAQPTSTRR
jgi:pimeloyl-ACP methyl ester carboxylesterase